MNDYSIILPHNNLKNLHEIFQKNLHEIFQKKFLLDENIVFNSNFTLKKDSFKNFGSK